MSDSEMEQIKKVAIHAAQDAGSILEKMYRDRVSYTMKNERDIISEADLESEKIILGHIRKQFPDHGILSEEQGESGSHEFRWIVDPLDGTINFAKGIDEFCVSIAVEHKESVVFGCIFDPIRHNLYTAEKGCGAFLWEKPMKVSDEKQCINSLLAMDNTSNIDARNKNFALLSHACAAFRHIRIFGSSSLHLARIAEGSLDAYYKIKINYWDCAAGILLIQEAGGRVTDFSGKEVGAAPRNIIASNGRIHNEVRDILNK